MSKGFFALAGAAIVLFGEACGAVAQPSDSAPWSADGGDREPSINARWLSGPAGGDMDRLYPPSALALKVEGEVTMRCLVADGGSLSRCDIKFEQPAGFGFGLATLKLASRYRVALQTREGASTVGGAVTLHIYWKLPTAG